MNLAANIVSPGASAKVSARHGGSEEPTDGGDGFARLLGAANVIRPGTAADFAGAANSDARENTGQGQQSGDDDGRKSAVTSPALLATMAGLALPKPVNRPDGAAPPKEPEQGMDAALPRKPAGAMPSGTNLEPNDRNAASPDVLAGTPPPALQLAANEPSSREGPRPAPKSVLDPAAKTSASDAATPLPASNGKPDPEPGSGAAAGLTPSADPGLARTPAGATVGPAPSRTAPESPFQPPHASNPASPPPAAAASAPAVMEPARPTPRGAAPQPSGDAGEASGPETPARTALRSLAAASPPPVGRGMSAGAKSDAGEKRAEAKVEHDAAPTPEAAPSPMSNRSATPTSGTPAGPAASPEGSPPVDVSVLSSRVTAGGSTLVLQLQPRELGTVTAQIRIGADMVKVDLKADSTEAARLLASDGDTLRKALEAIGIGRDMSVSVTISGPSAPTIIQGQPAQGSQTAGQSFQFSSGGDRSAGGNPGQGGGGRPSAGDQFGTSGQSRDGDSAQLSPRSMRGLVV